MPNRSIQAWRNFTIFKEADLHEVADLVAQLDGDLAEIDKPHSTTVIDLNSSTV